MRLPEFTAEASLFRSTVSYCGLITRASGQGVSSVTAARFSPPDIRCPSGCYWTGSYCRCLKTHYDPYPG